MVARFVTKIIDVFACLAILFLGLRVVLRLLGANPTAGFVGWVYDSSDTLMQPFRGIFPPAVIGRTHVVDFPAIFAIMIYGLIAVLFITLIARIGKTTASPTKKKA